MRHASTSDVTYRFIVTTVGLGLGIIVCIGLADAYTLPTCRSNDMVIIDWRDRPIKQYT